MRFGVFLLIPTRQSFLLTVVPHGKFTMKSIGMIGFQTHCRIGYKHTNEAGEQSHLSSLTGVRCKHRRLRSGLTVSFSLSLLPLGKRRKNFQQYLQLGASPGFAARCVSTEQKVFKETFCHLWKKRRLYSKGSDFMGRKKNAETSFVAKIEVILFGFVFTFFFFT